MDVVGEAAALAHLEEEARGHSGAEHRREHLERVAIGMVDRDARVAEDQVRLLRVLVVDRDARAGRPVELRRAGAAVAVARNVPEQLLEHRREVVADHPGDAHDHAVGRVPLVDVVGEGVAACGVHRVLRADDLPAERVVAVHQRLVDRADVVARRVLVHVHLLDDHALLAVDLLGLELRMAEHVEQDVERDIALLAGAPDVVARVLLGGEGIELAADPVDQRRQVARVGPALGALEEHVLGEVRDPPILGALVARAGGDHHETGDRLCVRQGRCEDAQPVAELLVFEHGHAAML